MRPAVAFVTKRDEIMFSILARMAAKLLVVDLKIRHGPT